MATVATNWSDWFRVSEGSIVNGKPTFKVGDITLINAGEAVVNGGFVERALPNGNIIQVKMTFPGFADFSPYLFPGNSPTKTFNGSIGGMIYTGTRKGDNKAASIAAGFLRTAGDESSWYVPKGYIWHHNQNLGGAVDIQDKRARVAIGCRRRAHNRCEWYPGKPLRREKMRTGRKAKPSCDVETLEARQMLSGGLIATTLASFENTFAPNAATFGANEGVTLDSAGDVFGTTTALVLGESYEYFASTIFEVAHATGVVTTLV